MSCRVLYEGFKVKIKCIIMCYHVKVLKIKFEMMNVSVKFSQKMKNSSNEKYNGIVCCFGTEFGGDPFPFYVDAMLFPEHWDREQ